MGKFEWQPLESNPDTINQFLEKIGVESVECVDVYSFDDDNLSFVPKPQLAMLLCFPDYEKVDAIMAPIYDKMKSECATLPTDIFFMKQKINNACGTFALFHALANLEGVINLGSGSFYKWFTMAKSVDADQRSDLLANDDILVAAHDEAARSGDSEQPAKVDHHFICYVNIKETLYEIDSRAPFPRPLGPTSCDSLVKDAGSACNHLMKELNNVSFAAMALIPKN